MKPPAVALSIGETTSMERNDGRCKWMYRLVTSDFKVDECAIFHYWHVGTTRDQEFLLLKPPVQDGFLAKVGFFGMTPALFNLFLYVFICFYIYIYFFLICFNMFYIVLYVFICFYMFLYVFKCFFFYVFLHVFTCFYMFLYVFKCF